jgi:cytochrome c oxidase assembly protein subunit 15
VPKPAGRIDKYRQTPNHPVNFGMGLPEYQLIFYIEWTHRLLARLAGLFFALPLGYFVARRIIPLRETAVYIVMGLLFLGQAAAGWLMVASGLLDQPTVSHVRLTIHLLMACLLLGISLWVALGHHFGFRRTRLHSLTAAFGLAALLLLVVQITFGGLTAGLKAGHLSDTWPLLLGQLIPAGIFPDIGTIFTSPLTVLFIHRWLAFAGPPAVALLSWHAARRGFSARVRRGLAWLGGLAALQIALGVLTVLGHVTISLALLHQANAVLLLAGSVTILFMLLTEGGIARP